MKNTSQFILCLMSKLKKDDCLLNNADNREIEKHYVRTLDNYLKAENYKNLFIRRPTNCLVLCLLNKSNS